MGFIALLVPITALSIPLVAIVLSHLGKTQKNRIIELQLRKEVLELENKNYDSKIKLLDAEIKKYDKFIDGSDE